MKPSYIGSDIVAMTVEEWHQLFAKQTISINNTNRNSEYVQDILAQIKQIKPKLPPVLNKIFELHQKLFALEMLQKPISNNGVQYGSFIGYYTSIAISEVRESVEAIFESGLDANATREPETLQRVNETLFYLRHKMLTNHDKRRYYSNFYYMLWTCWLLPSHNESSLLVDELQHLEESRRELGSDLDHYSLIRAKSWMNLYLSRDEEARKLMKEWSDGSEIDSEDLHRMLAYLKNEEEWQRLHEWLEEYTFLLDDMPHRFKVSYFHYWDAVIQHLPAAEPYMWQILENDALSMRYIYEEKLLMYGRWQQWVDVQLSIGSEPLDYRATELSPVEKNKPEALLPYYHQAVERYVLLKNRDGYKKAVKLLKRLAKLYKKMKNTERWEQFISAFAARYSRFRALQEELRKGKLIP